MRATKIVVTSLLVGALFLGLTSLLHVVGWWHRSWTGVFVAAAFITVVYMLLLAWQEYRRRGRPSRY